MSGERGSLCLYVSIINIGLSMIFVCCYISDKLIDRLLVKKPMGKQHNNAISALSYIPGDVVQSTLPPKNYVKWVNYAGTIKVERRLRQYPDPGAGCDFFLQIGGGGSGHVLVCSSLKGHNP